MRALVIALVVVAGCKAKKASSGSGSGAGSGSAAPLVEIDWAKCDAAIDKAAAAPLDVRPKILFDGCQVCGGDWAPLLTWNTEAGSGGPRRELIEQRMMACHAFCTGDSKLKFMASVDKARGQSVNTPWRQLENACKAHVNGSADDRFMSAPFFALDRIARLVHKRGGTAAQTLATVEIPLPAVTISGAGPALPTVGATASTGTLQISVLGPAIYVGRLPRGKLTPQGVTADLGNPPYPGEEVKLDKLSLKLEALVGDDKTQTLTILAPQAMSAQKLVEIVAAAAPIAPVYLAATASAPTEGWELVGAIPIALEPGMGIAVPKEMTVQDLAKELSARKDSRVGVTKR